MADAIGRFLANVLNNKMGSAPGGIIRCELLAGVVVVGRLHRFDSGHDISLCFDFRNGDDGIVSVTETAR